MIAGFHVAVQEFRKNSLPRKKFRQSCRRIQSRFTKLRSVAGVTGAVGLAVVTAAGGEAARSAAGVTGAIVLAVVAGAVGAAARCITDDTGAMGLAAVVGSGGAAEWSCRYIRQREQH